MSLDAMKQALEALEECSRVPHIRGIQPTITGLRLAIEQAERVKRAEEAFAAASDEIKGEQAERQEPVTCSVCKEVHAILDADESQIIRNAEDGYPDGRKPRILTLQERVNALCVYASDWKRWCLEKENAAPPQQEKQKPVAWANINKHGDITHTSNKRMPWANTPLYTAPPQRQPLTEEQLKPIADEYRILFGGWVVDFARAIERAAIAAAKEKS